MEIRPATLDDYEALSALEAEVQAIHVEAQPHIYIPGGVYSRQSYAELFAAPGNFVVLAVEADQSVGYMHYEVKMREASDFTFARKSLHVHALSVKGTERRKGYGEALMNYALARAAEHEVDRVTLDVGAFNKAAYAFYEKLGFKAIAGDESQNWLILENSGAKIGLFQGMFPQNVLTFNPSDVRAIQSALKADGVVADFVQEDAQADGGFWIGRFDPVDDAAVVVVDAPGAAAHRLAPLADAQVVPRLHGFDDRRIVRHRE